MECCLPITIHLEKEADEKDIDAIVQALLATSEHLEISDPFRAAYTRKLAAKYSTIMDTENPGADGVELLEIVHSLRYAAQQENCVPYEKDYLQSLAARVQQIHEKRQHVLLIHFQQRYQ